MNNSVAIDIDYSRTACGTVDDPNIFFPDGGATHNYMVATAKALCEKCPVVAACLAHGLRHEPIGIWGGTTPSERQVMRKARNIRLEVLENPFFLK